MTKSPNNQEINQIDWDCVVPEIRSESCIFDDVDAAYKKLQEKDPKFKKFCEAERDFELWGI